MKKNRVLSIIGTRPEGIKMAPVVLELKKQEDFETILCSTGQHREMLDQVLGFFRLKPDMDLGLMTHNQTLATFTASAFTGLDKVITDTKPDVILAQGDTTTVFVASVLAYYHKIKFGHVEAGLRTDDKFRPFPEEMNRRLADQCSDFMFAPTELSKMNLLKENHPANQIFVTGNTGIDALLQIADTPFDWNASSLKALGSISETTSSANQNAIKPYVLITAHRRESFGEPFRELCTAIRDLADIHKDISFLYPVHLNPNVRGPVNEILTGVKNLSLVEPLDYRTFIAAMKNARVILTDSGGVQEEAPGLKVPVLVMRDTTERPEGVEAGVSRLVGTSANRIIEETSLLIRDEAERSKMTGVKNPYGDGQASIRIVEILRSHLRSRT